MEFKSEISEKPGFPSLNNLKFPESNKPELNLNEVGKEKVVALQKSISEINQQIKGRETLSKQIFNECEKIKTEINNFLSENKIVHVGVEDQTSVREKNDLRHKKIEVSELQLNEKINCWKDVALLKKELREYERDLTEREDRMNTLAKIMEED